MLSLVDQRRKLKAFFLPQNLYSRLFLTVVLVEAVFNIACEAYILSQGEVLRLHFGSSNVLPVYVGMFVFAHLIQLIFSLDAIHQRNTIQIMGLCVFNILLMIYAIVQISEVKESFADQKHLDHSIRVVTTLVPVMIGLCEIAFVYLAWKMSQDFGWDIYKNLGADRKIKRMFFKYQIFLCICKFDIVWVFGFCAQLVALVLKKGDYELYMTIAALPVTLVVLAAAVQAAKREIRWLMGVVMAFVMLGFAYFAFKLWRIWADDEEEYANTRKSLTLFAGISLIFLFLTETQAFIVFRNFGKGLAASMRHQSATKAAEAGFDEHGPHYQLESAKSSRMSID